MRTSSPTGVALMCCISTWIPTELSPSSRCSASRRKHAYSMSSTMLGVLYMRMSSPRKLIVRLGSTVTVSRRWRPALRVSFTTLKSRQTGCADYHGRAPAKRGIRHARQLFRAGGINNLHGSLRAEALIPLPAGTRARGLIHSSICTSVGIKCLPPRLIFPHELAHDRILCLSDCGWISVSQASQHALVLDCGDLGHCLCLAGCCRAPLSGGLGDNADGIQYWVFCLCPEAHSQCRFSSTIRSAKHA